MPSWNRDSDRALDAELRAARPEASDGLTQAITDRVHPRASTGRHRFGKLHLALAGGLTALVLTPVVATGFGGFASFGKSTKASSKSGAALMSKARSGKALGSLRVSNRAALARLARAGGGTSAATLTGAGSGSGAALASTNDVSGFLGGIFAPQNDFEATQDEYALNCEIDALIQENDAELTQGGNTATGGNATATGGAGGDASTGNTQTNTGAGGGDTEAESGDATGGNGGNATATGGDAVAGNVATQILINNACVSP